MHYRVAYRRPVARLATDQVRARRRRPAALSRQVCHVVMHVLARARHRRAIVDVVIVGELDTPPELVIVGATTAVILQR